MFSVPQRIVCNALPYRLAIIDVPVNKQSLVYVTPVCRQNSVGQQIQAVGVEAWMDAYDINQGP